MFSKEFTDDFFSRLESMKMELDEFEQIEGKEEEPKEPAAKEDSTSTLLYCIYVFNTLAEVITVANQLAPFYQGDSSVYKSPQNGRYYLSLCMETTDEHLLNKICSILTEQGEREEPSYAKELFYVEHFEEIIADKAIEKLGQI
jgi:adapter protein MecA 1/2